MDEWPTHINYPLVAKSHTPEYLMHKFWARKPHNVVAEYIKNYSKPGEIVLDPFCGSGVTAIEAIKHDRKAVAIDLDPVATFITCITLIPVNIEKLKRNFTRIEYAVKDEILELYKTRCIECNSKDAIIIQTVWESSKENIFDEKPLEIRYKCDNCSRRGFIRKNLDKQDHEKIKEIEKININYWYPDDILSYDGSHFLKREKIRTVNELFTKRNLFSLALLWNEIEALEDIIIKNLMKLAFTSSVAQVSRLIGDWPSSGPSWKLHSYWTPPKHLELNVWHYFKNRFNSIEKGKEFSNNEIRNIEFANDFKELLNQKNIFVKTHDAVELYEIIPKNSVDYTFTDPPYGGSIQYMELSLLWSSWLKGKDKNDNFKLNFKDEITINRNQNKDFGYYHQMMKTAFSQIYKVLKPEGWLTVTFHNTSIKVWNSIIKAVKLAGFDLEKIIYQPPAITSATAQLQPYGSAIGDYYIRFKKPRIKRSTPIIYDEKRHERVIIECAKEIIAKRGEPTAYTYILNGIIPALEKEGALLIGSKEIDKTLKKYINDVFILIDTIDESGKVGKKWWFKDPEIIPYLEIVPLDERVEKAVIEVLRNRIKVKFDDVLQNIFISFPNALTPETHSIKEVLEEYAEKTRDGKWRLKRSFEETYSQHPKIMGYLSKIGLKSGYEIWIGIREQSDIFEDNPLSTLVNASLARVGLNKRQIDRIKNIDVLWIKNNEIKYAFEVENTTGITEALLRCSNIPYEFKRVLVIPEEREKLLRKKFNEPLIEEEKEKWNVIFYTKLQEFYNSNIRRKSIKENEIDKLFGKKASIDEKGQMIMEVN